MVRLEFSAAGTVPDGGVPDMTRLTVLDEEVINRNLRERYAKDNIYTYTGSILVAVNPYKPINVYTEAHVRRYHGRKLGAEPPHVFALAEAAYAALRADGPAAPRSQSVVISGESGAGKTETARFLLRHVCSVTSGAAGAWLEQQILEANTVLEAFGNARTVRNDNSSRFGKFVRVCFGERWTIAGCIVRDYLLERSRIAFRAPRERNYHVFYQLVDGARRSPELAERLRLRDAPFYAYLGGEEASAGDVRPLDGLRLAFEVLQVPAATCAGIFRTLSAILWLGNLAFQDVDGERCELTDDDEEALATVTELLGLEADGLRRVVLMRQINVRGNITEIPLRVQEAGENRHAMARALYSRTFAWLVAHINACTDPGGDSGRFLGVLDIFGFENFAVNSFEQLCINYTNEKLHRFFNHYVFALEQSIYREEGIRYNHIEFTDNTLCLELLERPPRCVLRLLSEQCHLPRGCDASYLSNLHAEFGGHERYVKGDDKRRWEAEFGVRHYAGTVMYSVAGFVDKNRDVQQDVFFDAVARSSDAFVRALGAYRDEPCAAGNGTAPRGGTGKGKPTVADAFRHQLQALIDVLESTTPWYVRCIKPNARKAPDEYDDGLVLDQLKYLGMLDIIRIRKEGFPVHMAFGEFVARYRCLAPAGGAQLPDCEAEACEAIIRGAPRAEWQIGRAKVFMRPHVHGPLEEARAALLARRAVVVQSAWRGYRARARFERARRAALRIQHAFRGWRSRIGFLRRRRAAVLIQSRLRGVFAREVAAALREMRRVEEEMRKREARAEEERRAARDAEMEERAQLEQSERAAQKEIAALSHMAEQLRMAEQPAEAVDLDNLFAFLSDVRPTTAAAERGGAAGHRNQIIDEIGERMSELVGDLDVELETVIQQELEGLAQEQHGAAAPALRLGPPSLPEPTGPPPPPPDAAGGAGEPIYEAVLPRDEAAEPEGAAPPDDDVAAPANWRHSQQPHELQQQQEASGADVGAEREQRRKFRVERKLQELSVETQERDVAAAADDAQHHDMLEFAEAHFNAHERAPEGTIIATLTRRRQGPAELVPKAEMIVYCKGGAIPTSHVHMYDPDNVAIAVAMFRDLCKYARGELSGEKELAAVQSIVGHALEREELRDEVLVQCVRQATNNPHAEGAERVWLLLCLCVVAFQPSRPLHRYFVSFLRRSAAEGGGRVAQFAQWCLDNCKGTRASVRERAPSGVEVAAMKRLGTIVCRFFFLDGRTKAIDVHPTDTAGDAARKLADRLGLRALDGWAIYQSGPEGEEHVRAHHFLYDVIAAWESQNKMAPAGGITTLGRRGATTVGGGDNRFVFKRRLFRGGRELSQDPVEVNLLYAQAVHGVVKNDDFPVTEKVALQLAGLQAQVALGDPKENSRPEYYTDIDTYLPYRISRQRGDDVWVPIIAHAHRQYGAGRSELTAKALYLSCVMQYPLYGTTMFAAAYRGYWPHGDALTLGVGRDGLLLIRPDDKAVLAEHRYADVDRVMLDPADSFVTIALHQRHHAAEDSAPHHHHHRYLVLETPRKAEVGALVASYCPALAERDEPPPVAARRATTAEDRARLHRALVASRRALADGDLLRRPEEASGGLLRSTLRRLRSARDCAGDTYKGYDRAFWAFTRQPLERSLSRLPEPDCRAATDAFRTVLRYAGIAAARADDGEHVAMLQSVVARCMRKDALLTELYLQLIKQTTDHPDAGSRANLRHWALLSLACSVAAPPHAGVRRHLACHLRRCGADRATEEGRFARFAERCAQGAARGGRRRWPPSREEALCTINRRAACARFHFMDGRYQPVEFRPSATAEEVLATVRDKIGLRADAKGYAIYEVLGNSERSLGAEEKVADVMAKWERYRAAAAAGAAGGAAKRARPQHHYFLFKKHLFTDASIDLGDDVEKELLYHQVLNDLRTDRFPITEKEATMLTALQSQLELGDCGDPPRDYGAIARHCLPARIVPCLSPDGVAMHHQSLRGMTPSEAKQAFLNLIQSWPLHRATIFDVMQSFTSNWPRVLWLAVDQRGLHLLEHRSRNSLCTYEYGSIASYSPALNCLMIITGSECKQSKVILTTAQAFQIATLIREYAEEEGASRRPAAAPS